MKGSPQARERPILAIANAGGHLTQALCALSCVENFHLVTTVKIEAKTRAIEIHYLKGTQYNPLIFAVNFLFALRLINRLKPAALFSTGGPACLPFALAAKLLGKRFVYLDTLSRVRDLSNTAKFLYRFGLFSVMMTQWQPLTEKYKGVSYRGKIFDICNIGN